MNAFLEVRISPMRRMPGPYSLPNSVVVHKASAVGYRCGVTSGSLRYWQWALEALSRFRAAPYVVSL